jgi:hypothetical protein
MNIQNINPGSNLSPDQIRSGQPDEVQQTERTSAPEPASDAPSRPAEDSVEISEAGRAAQENAPEVDPVELQSARKAMLDIPPLSPDRAEDIFKRVNAGYYSQPNALRNVAEGIANEMLGQPPESDGAQ